MCRVKILDLVAPEMSCDLVNLAAPVFLQCATRWMGWAPAHANFKDTSHTANCTFVYIEYHTLQNYLYIIHYIFYIAVYTFSKSSEGVGTKSFCMKLGIYTYMSTWAMSNLLLHTFAHWLEHISRRVCWQGHISGSKLLFLARGPGRGHGSLPDVELRLDEHAVSAKYAKFAKCAKIAIHVTSSTRNSF